MNNKIFQHSHAAHCESGVMANLLRHHGLELSEPMAFGLSAALVFVHLPWLKMGGIPLTAYRMLPGAVVNGLQKALGVRMQTVRYRNAEAAMQDLDRRLDAGEVVGLQTSVFWLPYLPPDMRFHFNAHNLIVFGRDGDEYLISDPVGEHTVRCPRADLAKARFARGPFAPRGKLYTPLHVPADPELAPAIRRAVRKTASRMVKAPMPFLGVRGIRLLASRLEQAPRRYPDLEHPRAVVASVVRMQEEIGTGGAGFRFMFASFLQESGELLADDRLLEASARMTGIGDQWREFALKGARLFRKQSAEDYAGIAALLREIAAGEEAVFRDLLAASR